jgi:hypothetical protein
MSLDSKKRYELWHRDGRPSDWFATEHEARTEASALYYGIVFDLPPSDRPGRQTILGRRNGSEVEDNWAAWINWTGPDEPCEIRFHPLGRSGLVDD